MAVALFDLGDDARVVDKLGVAGGHAQGVGIEKFIHTFDFDFYRGQCPACVQKFGYAAVAVIENLFPISFFVVWQIEGHAQIGQDFGVVDAEMLG